MKDIILRCSNLCKNYGYTPALKNVDISIKNVERKRYCSVCGKEMSVYDGDIQEANGSEIICKECLEKALKNKQ